MAYNRSLTRVKRLSVSQKAVNEVKEQMLAHMVGSQALVELANKKLVTAAKNNTKKIVESHFKAAVRNVKSVFRRGIQDSTTHLDGMILSDVKMQPLRVLLQPKWAPLSKTTLQNKFNWPGGGVDYATGEVNTPTVFHYSSGELWLSVRSLPVPNITVTSEIEEPKKGKAIRQLSLASLNKPVKLDFTLMVSASRMEFPLDELVRRPLLLGSSPQLMPADVHGEPRDGLNLVALLETGIRRKVPPRPFIKQMSRQLHLKMKDRIRNQTL